MKQKQNLPASRTVTFQPSETVRALLAKVDTGKTPIRRTWFINKALEAAMAEVIKKHI